MVKVSGQCDYPHLRPLCLAPDNECGVKKLICTFIKVQRRFVQYIYCSI